MYTNVSNWSLSRKKITCIPVWNVNQVVFYLFFWDTSLLWKNTQSGISSIVAFFKCILECISQSFILVNYLNLVTESCNINIYVFTVSKPDHTLLHPPRTLTKCLKWIIFGDCRATTHLSTFLLRNLIFFRCFK